jgi:hypothetical protein
MTETIEAKPEDNLFLAEYENALQLLLADHTRSFADNPDLFHATFFNRGEERNRFWGLLSSSTDPDRTLIVTGAAGVGKTSFVYDIVFGRGRPPEANILPIMADFRTAVPQNVEGCLINFIQNAKQQLGQAGLPLDAMKDNTPDNVLQNVRFIHDSVKLLASTKNAPRAIIFLDDFDYAEQQWFRLLDYFLPFVMSEHCGVVLTMRPRLYAAIQAYDDRLRFYFGRNVQKVHLSPMPVREVLASRLAPILVSRASRSVLYSIIAQFKGDDRIGKIATKLGVRGLSALPNIEFPFTEKHNDFMQRITNGNLREVQEIAMDSLLFVIRAGRSLETQVESDIRRTVIGRENTLRLFYDDPRAHYHMLDINKHRSPSGNSLLYNVLEGLKISPQVDQGLFDRLRGFGHSEKNIRWAVDHLADRTQRLLEAKWILPRERAATLLRSDEYELTEKGNYYLDIAKWPEYQLRAKSFGKSVIEAAK